MPRIATISFSLLILTVILYLGNLVIYEAVVLAFGITEGIQLLSLGISLGVLSASFIAATFIGSWRYNFFTRIYYTLSAVWLGLFLYLFMASVVYGVAVAISQSYVNIGPLLFLIALLVSVYGILHAKKIIAEKVSISLPNLPSSWKGKKAIWVSDLHLGQIHSAAFTQKIVTQISALSPDIVFIGGDLYDGTRAPNISGLIAPLSKLSAPFGTYFITGNHEEYGGSKEFISTIASVGIRVLQDEMIEIEGLQLIGVDYHNASDPARFKEILSSLAINRERASILLKHEPKDLNVAQAAGVSLQISGHTHKAQLWPLSYVVQLTYKGFGYGLKTLEDMQIYTSSGTGTWGPPMRVGTNSEIVLFTLE
jgi:hypothetical protein